MRTNILLKSRSDTLETHHQQALAAAILSKIRAVDSQLANRIHNDLNTPKPLAYSRLLGLQYSDNEFIIPGLVTLEVGWRADVVDALAQGIALEPVWRICDTIFDTLEVTIEPSVPPQKEGRFCTLSPIIIDRTQHEGYNRWIVYEEDPKGFLERIQDNICKRYKWQKGQPPKRTIEVRAPRGLVTRFIKWGDNLWFPAAEGVLELKGDPLLVQMAHEMGVGRHSGMGFGMLASGEGVDLF